MYGQSLEESPQQELDKLFEQLKVHALGNSYSTSMEQVATTSMTPSPSATSTKMMTTTTMMISTSDSNRVKSSLPSPSPASKSVSKQVSLQQTPSPPQQQRTLQPPPPTTDSSRLRPSSTSSIHYSSSPAGDLFGGNDRQIGTFRSAGAPSYTYHYSLFTLITSLLVLYYLAIRK